MDRLSIWLTFVTGPILVGVPIIILFTLEYFAWPAIAVTVMAGLLVSWPVAYALSRKIKRQDPEWDETGVEKTGMIPRPGSPEV